MSKLARLLVLGLVLAGCGGDDEAEPAAAGPPLDACQLFGPNDAKVVLKDNVGLMQSMAEDAMGRDLTVCAYSAGYTPPDIASLKIHRHRSAERAEGTLDSVASTLRGREVPGLGDGAVWVERMGQLHVRRGALQLTVTVQAPQVPDPFAAARGIAETALSRLPAAS
ncbi:MAG TPA: hypothetical protein VNJ70_00265 [Thermoanaerobaculia bacterium]|nr:hypothetical protein [Thermoanaerobaculia bacterium]